MKLLLHILVNSFYHLESQAESREGLASWEQMPQMSRYEIVWTPYSIALYLFIYIWFLFHLHNDTALKCNWFTYQNVMVFRLLCTCCIWHYHDHQTDIIHFENISLAPPCAILCDRNGLKYISKRAGFHIHLTIMMKYISGVQTHLHGYYIPPSVMMHW